MEIRGRYRYVGNFTRGFSSIKPWPNQVVNVTSGHVKKLSKKKRGGSDRPTLILKARTAAVANITNINVRPILVLPALSGFAANITDIADDF